MRPRLHRRHTDVQRQSGAALLALLVALVLGAMYFLVDQVSQAAIENARERDTASALAAAREALLGYAITYRDEHPNDVFGYFPCPDTNGDGSAQASCGTAGTAVVGLLPYRTLGLPVLRDSDGECLWYAVSGNYKNSPAAAPLNWDTQGQFQVNDPNGTALVAPDDTNGGAAVVIFAPGAPVGSQSRTNLSSSACGRAGTSPNAFLDGNYTFPTSASPIALQAGIRGSPTNNDRMLWITPKEVWDRIASRMDFKSATTSTPPGDLNSALQLIQAELNSYSPDNLPKPKQRPPRTGDLNPPEAGEIGNLRLGFLDPADVPIDTKYDAYGHSWLEQARYVICKDKDSCLTCNGASHAAVLVFSGRSATGYPRTSIEKFSLNEANRGKAQFATSLASYLDGTNLSSFATAGTTYAGTPSYSDVTSTADVVLCIDPTGGGEGPVDGGGDGSKKK